MMSTSSTPFRTPRGRGKAGKGALSGLHPQELLARALEHLAERAHLRREDVEDVIIGCVTQVNEQGRTSRGTPCSARASPTARPA